MDVSAHYNESNGLSGFIHGEHCAHLPSGTVSVSNCFSTGGPSKSESDCVWSWAFKEVIKIKQGHVGGC